MWALLIMWQCINEERGKMSLMRMTLPIHSYLHNLCLACNPENNNRWNYALRVRCFIIVLNVFRWCVTLGNRVHDICIETELRRKRVKSKYTYLCIETWNAHKGTGSLRATASCQGLMIGCINAAGTSWTSPFFWHSSQPLCYLKQSTIIVGQ
jgi:hypothetical protein